MISARIERLRDLDCDDALRLCADNVNAWTIVGSYI